MEQFKDTMSTECAIEARASIVRSNSRTAVNSKIIDMLGRYCPETETAIC